MANRTSEIFESIGTIRPESNPSYSSEEKKFWEAQYHYLDSVNSIALISSLLFGFAVTIWYQTNYKIFEENGFLELGLIFHCCLSLAMMLSGYSVILMVGHYHTLKIKLGKVISEQISLDAYNNHLLRTINLRTSSRSSVIIAFLGLIFAVIFYNCSRYRRPNTIQILELAITTCIYCGGLVIILYSLKNMWKIRCCSREKNNPQIINNRQQVKRQEKENPIPPIQPPLTKKTSPSPQVPLPIIPEIPDVPIKPKPSSFNEQASMSYLFMSSSSGKAALALFEQNNTILDMNSKIIDQNQQMIDRMASKDSITGSKKSVTENSKQKPVDLYGSTKEKYKQGKPDIQNQNQDLYRDQQEEEQEED